MFEKAVGRPPPKQEKPQAKPAQSAHSQKDQNQKKEPQQSANFTLDRELIQRFYAFHEEIGSGGFSKVRLASHLLTGEKVAVKVIDKRAIGHDLPRVYIELEALRQLAHQNICRMYQYVETPEKFYIVMEYCNGGEMFDYIVAKERLAESEARHFFRQLVQAVAYLHHRGFAHRDLKPENLLLTRDLQLKLVDFGLCAKPALGLDRPLDTCCGSPCYAAPELLKNTAYYGNEADIWSMGVVLYCLLCGALPYDDSNINRLYQKITTGQYYEPTHLSQQSREFLRQMLTVDPKRRITIKGILAHPWLNKNYEQAIKWTSIYNKDVIDEEVSRELAFFGQTTLAQVEQTLRQWKFDYLTATYLILLQKKERRQKFSLLPTRQQQQFIRFPIASEANPAVIGGGGGSINNFPGGPQIAWGNNVFQNNGNGNVIPPIPNASTGGTPFLLQRLPMSPPPPPNVQQQQQQMFLSSPVAAKQQQTINFSSPTTTTHHRSLEEGLERRTPTPVFGQQFGAGIGGGNGNGNAVPPPPGFFFPPGQQQQNQGKQDEKQKSVEKMEQEPSKEQQEKQQQSRPHIDFDFLNSDSEDDDGILLGSDRGGGKMLLDCLPLSSDTDGEDGDDGNNCQALMKRMELGSGSGGGTTGSSTANSPRPQSAILYGDGGEKGGAGVPRSGSAGAGSAPIPISFSPGHSSSGGDGSRGSSRRDSREDFVVHPHVNRNANLASPLSTYYDQQKRHRPNNGQQRTNESVFSGRNGNRSGPTSPISCSVRSPQKRPQQQQYYNNNNNGNREHHQNRPQNQNQKNQKPNNNYFNNGGSFRISHPSNPPHHSGASRPISIYSTPKTPAGEAPLPRFTPVQCTGPNAMYRRPSSVDRNYYFGQQRPSPTKQNHQQQKYHQNQQANGQKSHQQHQKSSLENLTSKNGGAPKKTPPQTPTGAGPGKSSSAGGIVVFGKSPSTPATPVSGPSPVSERKSRATRSPSVRFGRRIYASLERKKDRVMNLLTPRKPREAPMKLKCTKTMVNVSVTSSRDPIQIRDELFRVLAKQGLVPKQNGWKISGTREPGADGGGGGGHHQQTIVELEVVAIDGLDYVGVKRRRVRGDAFTYKKICEEVLRLAGL